MSAVRKASGLVSIKHASIRGVGGQLKAERVRARDAAGLKLVFSALAATASPDSVRGYGNSAGTVTIATPSTTASPSGGVAPFTYVWTRTDGGPHPWTIGDNHAATTNFTTSCDSGENETATFHCTITDATGATAVTGDVNAHALNLGGGL